MSVADKYMSEVNNKKFKFIPPQFDKSVFKGASLIRQSESLDLFPAETKNEQMYCYYNELTGCNNKKDNMAVSRGGEEEENDTLIVNIPSPCEILRKYNFADEYEDDEEGQRSSNDVEKIYLNIVKHSPNIIDSLVEYKIPVPIAKLITKKIIKLSLECNKECNIL